VSNQYLLTNQSRSRKPFNVVAMNTDLDHMNRNLTAMNLTNSHPFASASSSSSSSSSSAAHLINQSRSNYLKPSSQSPTPQQPLINQHHAAVMTMLAMENTTTSFDDLDAVEEINLNQHNVINTNSRLNSQLVNNRVVNRSSIPAVNSKHHVLSHPYFYSDSDSMDSLQPTLQQQSIQQSLQQPFKPTSILKRVDSKKKLAYNLNSSHVSQHHHHRPQYHVEGSTLPKNFTMHENCKHMRSSNALDDENLIYSNNRYV
jgi:hypothetical protein